jgi:hypothetical protein
MCTGLRVTMQPESKPCSVDLSFATTRIYRAQNVLDRFERHALRVVANGPIPPACLCQAPAEVGGPRLRNIHMKRADSRLVALLRQLSDNTRSIGPGSVTKRPSGGQ